jgi:hypothetical protein
VYEKYRKNNIMNVNFLVNQATFMRYYVPLAYEVKMRRHIANFFIGKKPKKYNDPMYKRNFENIKGICKYFKFNLFKIEDCKNFDGITFNIEGNGIKYANKSTQKLVTLTCMNDATARYNGKDAQYINEVDNVILASEFMAKHLNTISHKNMYLGSPKYDFPLNKDKILHRYKLNSKEKYALILYPKLRDLKKINLNKIYDYLRKLGYKLLVKTREKDPVLFHEHRGDFYFLDASWFPSTTIELLNVSDIVINFSSTAIKECVMCKTPVINFDIKPFKLLFDFLYKYDYIIHLDPNVSFDIFSMAVKKLTTQNLESEFNLAIKNHLFESGNVSKKICDALNIL